MQPHSNPRNLRLDGVLLWLSPFGQLQEMLDKLDLALLLELSILLVDPPFVPATEIIMLAWLYVTPDTSIPVHHQIQQYTESWAIF